MILRIVTACDSRVVVGAVSKGRGSSRVLNKHLRRLCSICVAHGLELRILWAGTHSNPTDGPTRFAPLPLPKPQTDWMQEVVDREPQVIAIKGSRGGMCGAVVLSRVAGCPGCTTVCKSTPAARGLFWQQHFVAVGYSDNAQLREYDSGCGRLSTAIAQQGINVKAYEAFPK